MLPLYGNHGVNFGILMKAVIEIISTLYCWAIEITKCDTLSDLELFVQYKKHEKHPWRSELKVTLLHGCL